MNKGLILISVTVFSIIGSYIPFLFGETDIFSLWVVLGGFVGGLFGVWFGVYLSRRWG